MLKNNSKIYFKLGVRIDHCNRKQGKEGNHALKPARIG